MLTEGPVVVPPGRLHAFRGHCFRRWRAALQRRPVGAAWLARPRPGRPTAARRARPRAGPGDRRRGGAAGRRNVRERHSVVRRQNHGRVAVRADGAWLAHIAAHGTFRTDSPIFSSLRLLTAAHRLRLRAVRRAPYWMILPSCDSGVLAPAGAETARPRQQPAPAGTAALTGVVRLTTGPCPAHGGAPAPLAAGRSRLADALSACGGRSAMTGHGPRPSPC